MDDSKKKSVMIALAVVCLVVAVAIPIMRNSGGGVGDFSNEEMIMLQCSNTGCAAVLEMGKKDYFVYAEQNTDINGAVKPMACEKCGKDSVQPAVKCEKCETVFIKGAAGGGKLPDTCPKCGFSAVKERRKANRTN